MKHILLVLALPLALLSCKDRKNDKLANTYNGGIPEGTTNSGHPAAEIKDSTTVMVLDTLYNFGTIKEGEKVEYSFRFKNTGTKPLIISEASASCGCTVPEKPQEPIKPGETSFIKVVFNSKGKVGENEKAINVSSNAYPSFPILKLKGTVK